MDQKQNRDIELASRISAAVKEMCGENRTFVLFLQDGETMTVLTNGTQASVYGAVEAFQRVHDEGGRITKESVKRQ